MTAIELDQRAVAFLAEKIPGLEVIHQDVLEVDWSQMAYELPTAPHGFAQCTLLETLPTVHWGFTLSTFRFYDCRNWSGEPKPRLKGER